jgi:type II secretory pathway component PulM
MAGLDVGDPEVLLLAAVPVLVVLAGVYVVFLRPGRKRRRAEQEQRRLDDLMAELRHCAEEREPGQRREPPR